LLQGTDWLVAAAHGPDAWRAAQSWGARSRWLDAAAGCGRQRRDDACGPACLEILLRHHGRRVRQSLLWNICRLPHGGTSMQRLAVTAGRFGLPCRIGAGVELGDLPLPAVVHLRRRHFVVLLGVDARNALVIDPACGRIRIPAAALRRQASGIVLVCGAPRANAADAQARAAGTPPAGVGG